MEKPNSTHPFGVQEPFISLCDLQCELHRGDRGRVPRYAPRYAPRYDTRCVIEANWPLDDIAPCCWQAPGWRIPEACTRSLHQKLAPEPCTGSFHQKLALEACTRSFHQKLAPKAFTRRLHRNLSPDACIGTFRQKLAPEACTRSLHRKLSPKGFPSVTSAYLWFWQVDTCREILVRE